MCILSSLSWIFIRVALSKDISMETTSSCVDMDSDICQSTSWMSCEDDDVYLELCCWSCHTVVLLPGDMSSCRAGGWHDVMTKIECSKAAWANQMTFIILNNELDMLDVPVGCSKVDQEIDVYQWNPALRADDYDYTDYEVGAGPLRLCLEPRRSIESDDDYRAFVPRYMGVRSGMDLPENWDNSGTIRFLEAAFTCAEVEPYCQLVENEDDCKAVADELNIAFNSDDPLEYVPGGCYYYDNTVFWNYGYNIEFPPKFTSAYYSHFCHACREETCPLPLWTQLSLVALSVTFVCVLVAVVCFNIQNKNEEQNNGFEPAEAVHQVDQPLQELDDFQPGFDGRQEEQYNFVEPEPYYSTGRKPLYPLSAGDSRDMPEVPMNLGNHQGY